MVRRGVMKKEGKSMPWKVFAIVMGHLAVKCVISPLSIELVEYTGVGKYRA